MPTQGIDIAAVLAFIADNEPLTATLARFAPNDHASLREALRNATQASAATAAPGPKAKLASKATAPVAVAPTVQTTAPKPASKTGTGSRMVVYSDGASRGNPGLSGAGWVICDMGGKTIATGGMFLGKRTNNEAEYLAAAMGIQAARDLGADELVLRADSELMVRQLQGRYQVRNAKLLPLFNQIKMLRQGLRAFYAEHVPREQNAPADAQANRAIDER